MDKMREEFEGWLTGCGIEFSVNEVNERLGLELSYAPFHVQSSWAGWKASRAALCVELPKDISGEYYADGWNSALASVEVRLRESGVGFK